MQRALTHILDRTTRVPRPLERERRQRRPMPSQLLRQHALMLRTQRHLIEITAPAVPRPVPIKNKTTCR